MDHVMCEEGNLREYYNRRSIVYEKIYHKPERQADLALLAAEVSQRLKGHDVLEIACGTGYWTERYAPQASSVLCVDQSVEMLDVARLKNITNAQFIRGDAYKLLNVEGKFNACFTGFWWSHVPLEKQQEFLCVLHSKLCSGAKIVMIDNHYVAGSNHPVTRTDASGNTYQTRKLPCGTSYEILKNFPADNELKTQFSPFAAHIEIKRLTYYWLAEYILR